MTKIRDLNPSCRNENSCNFGAYNYYDEFKNLCMNALKIYENGSPLNFATENFVKEQLIENGCVGFDGITKQFARVAGEGIDKLGNPTKLNFFFLNGTAFIRRASYEPKENGAYILYSLPSKNSIANVIKYTTDFMHLCDEGIRQNEEAVKTPYIVVCKNDETRLSLIAALKEKQDGQAAIIVDADIAEGLKSVNIGVEYVADKLLELRDKERDHLLNKLGVMSANINKKERVQVGEVNATEQQVIDYIYLLIDTFNDQCVSYGLPYEMQLDNSLEELYENEEVDEDVDETDEETEKEGDMND